LKILKKQVNITRGFGDGYNWNYGLEDI
jgi:hypothetical protein